MNKKITSYLTKMKRASGQYRKRLGRCPQLPVRLWIEPTNRCNLKCIMCPNADPPKDAKYGDMDMALYRKLIDEAAGFAIDINLFARGESLLHKDIFEMIRYANSKGLRTRLETNATILDKDRSRELIDSGLNFLSFSIDGYAKEAYEKIRVNGVFEVTMKNILDLLEAKKASGRKRPFVMIQVIELASIKEGVDKNEKTNFINLFKGLPVNGFRFIVPHRFGGVIDKDVT
ncbi:MAG: radical SAM protein, partial [Candidatus Omnitrophica bacterium]|nr:radical SAM protein [Candidatus Omnitrophota bacterium]